MNLLVCGGRDYSDALSLHEYLDSLELTDVVLICGLARGADSLAKEWAEENGYPVKEYPALWDVYGKSAGYVRNKLMLDDGKPVLVVAFPGGKGTAMMVDIARKAGVEVQEVAQ